MRDALLGIWGAILILLAYIFGQISDETLDKEGGAKSKTPEVVRCRVGERIPGTKKYGEKYDARFDFWILARDEFIRPELARGYLFDKYNVIATWPYARDVVIDVGANVGTFCIPISRQARVIAYEPQRVIFDLLQRNVKANRARVEAHHAAVGHERARVHLNASVADGESAGEPIAETEKLVNYGGLSLGEAGEACTMVRLDDLRADVSVLKVDVEGAEPLVFAGAQELIRRSHPVILFERNEKGVTPEMIRAMQLPQEVVTFDIMRFCLKEGYTTLVHLPRHNYLLIHPTRALPQFERENFEPRASEAGFKTYTFKKIAWKK